jgi:hypothetical protein
MASRVAGTTTRFPSNRMKSWMAAFLAAFSWVVTVGWEPPRARPATTRRPAAEALVVLRSAVMALEEKP